MSRMGLEPRAWSRRRVMLGRLRRQRKRASHPSPNWAKRVVKRNGRAVELITLDEFGPTPPELVLHNGTPDSIAGWKALADGLLTDQPCIFHRNLEISSRYAWMYKALPAYFKWAGMAAFASYHVRLALWPFRLDADRSGYVDIPHSIDRHRPHPGGLLAVDVETIRATNNAIFDDIFWVHLAYQQRRRWDRMSTSAPGYRAPLCRTPDRLRSHRRRTSCVGERDGLRDGSTDG